VSRVYTGDYQVAQLGLGGGDVPPAAALYDVLHSVDGEPNPFVGYSSPRLDELTETALHTLDEDERNEALIGIEEILLDECLYRPTEGLGLGPPFASDAVQDWTSTTMSVPWDDVWLSE